ncbi:MAG: hypothetical protein E4H14_11930 [Candidatus Thorarchaeota archaeon]|nr:MAG: hypothetical protein E4H14_11930 [Candidatus Thorarchaeota archaeon]
MQLDQFYLSIIQMTLIDAIALGAGAGMLACTYFGINLRRKESDGFSWLIGGTFAIIFGTIFGYYVMNTVGFIVTWSGSSIQGLAGADLTEWADTIAALFAPVQMQAAGFAMMGALFGVGWGYGIGARPDDTSKLGNLIATLGVTAILMGLLFMLLPSFITYTYDVAFMYLLLFNGLILLCYGIGAVMNQRQDDSSSEYVKSAVEELIV